MWRLADLGLPPEVEPFSFISATQLDHATQALALSSGETLVDLGCGRGGPGLWLAQRTGATLVGVDFSAVAVAHASQRAALFGMADHARFVVGDLTATGLPDTSADAAVSIDALHLATEPTAAAEEAFRILRPNRHLVMTSWRPRQPDDPRLPNHRRIDWPQTLAHAGFQNVQLQARPDWHDVSTRIYRAALSLGDPADDAALATLQDQARRNLPIADLFDRVLVTATRPARVL